MKKKKSEHKYLRRIVSWCVILMSFIVFATFITAWMAGEQVSSASVSAMLVAIVGELTLTIIKRKDDSKAEQKQEEKTEIPRNETI